MSFPKNPSTDSFSSQIRNRSLFKDIQSERNYIRKWEEEKSLETMEEKENDEVMQSIDRTLKMGLIQDHEIPFNRWRQYRLWKSRVENMDPIPYVIETLDVPKENRFYTDY